MDAKSTTTKFLIFMLLFILQCENACLGADEMCRENERKALLGIKQGLKEDHSEGWLSSWGNQEDHKECCSWEGVTCSLRTGHVDRLDLHYLHFPIFDSEICPALGELRHLYYLDLSFSDFGGIKIPECIGSLNKLEHLSLSWCNFSSVSPYQFESLTNLRHLDFSGNKFGGSKIAEFSGSFKKLQYLNLTKSHFSGDIPRQLWNLKNLRRLDLSHNSLQGTISEVHLSKLHNLTHLYLSFNSLALNLTPDWVPPFQLEEIRLARCSMGPRFPAWLQTQTKFTYLDLSSNSISSQVPNWLWDQSRGISYYLDISDNQFSGSVPLSSNSIVYLNVSSNNLSGHAPLFYPNSYVLHLSGNLFSGSIQSLCGVTYKNLQILDLSKNQLSGDIPDCWKHMPNLGVLNLADNKFNGHLPRGLNSLNFIQSLNFRNNNLTGELPTISNSSILELIDVGGNKLTGNVPRWLGELRVTSVLSLRHNNFYGSIPHEICHLSDIKILDLSHNSLSGTIPQCFDKFTSLLQQTRTSPFQGAYTGFFLNDNTRYNYINDAMVQWKRLDSEYKNTLGLLKLIDLSSNKLVGNIPPEISRLAALGSLNLSRNYLTGNIIRDIDAMTMLEILDLSKNNLSGKIPTNLAKLHYLAVLDLSDNSLSGKIPESTQLQSFDASTYAGNMALCGAPLSNCPGDNATRTSANHLQGNINEGSMIQSLFEEYFISALLGFIFGFWGIMGPISFKRSWRNTYYGYWSKIGDWLYRLYVTVTICKTRFR